MDHESVTIKGPDGLDTIRARTRIWAAGVQASPLAKMLAEKAGVDTDRAGRLAVNPDCTLPGHPEVFAIGDMVSLNKLPGVAQPALQEGKYVGKVIKARLTGQSVAPVHVLRQGHDGHHRIQGRRCGRIRRQGDRSIGLPDVAVHPRPVSGRMGQPASARSTPGRVHSCSPVAALTESSPTRTPARNSRRGAPGRSTPPKGSCQRRYRRTTELKVGRTDERHPC